MTDVSNKETQVHIGGLEAQYDANKDNLLERILGLVCDIKPESHINARIE